MQRRLFTQAAALCAMTALAGGARAQGQHHGGHGGSAGNQGAPKGDGSPSSVAFNEANVRMHAAMDIAFTGDADVDFARSMIPHHQGAIDMAKVVLAHGKDPAIRKLAEAVITAQQGEIAWMETWLKTKGK